MILWVQINEEEPVAFIAANGEVATLFWCIPEFEDRILSYLEEGIHFPEGTVLAKHNVEAGAPALDRARAVVALYREMFNFETDECEYPRATLREPEITVRLANKRFASFDINEERKVQEIFQKLVVGASYPVWGLGEAGHKKQKRGRILRLHQVERKAGSVELSFLVGTEEEVEGAPEDFIEKTVANMLDLLDNPVASDEAAPFLQEAKELGAFTQSGLEIRGQHLDGPITIDSAKVARYQVALKRAQLKTRCELTGIVKQAVHDNTWLKVEDSLDGRRLHCYFPASLEKQYWRIATAPKGTKVRIKGWRIRRVMLDRIDVESASIVSDDRR